MAGDLKPAIEVHIVKMSWMNHPVSINTIVQVLCEGCWLLNCHGIHEEISIFPWDDEELSQEGCMLPVFFNSCPWKISPLVRAKNAFPDTIWVKSNSITISNLRYLELETTEVRRHIFHIVKCGLGGWYILGLARGGFFRVAYLLQTDDVTVHLSIYIYNPPPFPPSIFIFWWWVSNPI